MARKKKDKPEVTKKPETIMESKARLQKEAKDKK